MINARPSGIDKYVMASVFFRFIHVLRCSKFQRSMVKGQGEASGADPGYILTTAQFRLSEILGCGSLDAGVAL